MAATSAYVLLELRAEQNAGWTEDWLLLSEPEEVEPLVIHPPPCGENLPRLLAGQRYCARLIEVDAAGNQSESAEQCTVAVDCLTPLDDDDYPLDVCLENPHVFHTSGCSTTSQNRSHALAILLVTPLVLTRGMQLSDKQWRTLSLLERLERGELTVSEVAASLGKSRRQVQRIRKRVLAEGQRVVVQTPPPGAQQAVHGSAGKRRTCVASSPVRPHARPRHLLAPLRSQGPKEPHCPSRWPRHRHPEASYSKVRAMTRVANADNEELLLTMARQTTAAQLERICRLHRQAVRPEGSPETVERDLRSCFRGNAER